MMQQNSNFSLKVKVLHAKSVRKYQQQTHVWENTSRMMLFKFKILICPLCHMYQLQKFMWEVLKKCVQKFQDLASLMSKQIQQSQVENKTSCVLCAKSFNFISSLKIHKQYFMSIMEYKIKLCIEWAVEYHAAKQQFPPSKWKSFMQKLSENISNKPMFEKTHQVFCPWKCYERSSDSSLIPQAAFLQKYLNRCLIMHITHAFDMIFIGKMGICSINYLTFLHRVFSLLFSNVSSNGLSEKRQSHISCICLTFSIVRFQMYPQMAWMGRGIVTLVAFVLPFLHCVNKMQTVWHCLFWDKAFENTFENVQRRKVKEMQPMWLRLFWAKQFEDTF